MRRSPFRAAPLLVSCLAVAGCLDREPVGTGAAVRPIVNGSPDTDHAGVGGLLIDEGEGFASLCTATPIADGWVLTAGHCAEGCDPADVAFFVGADIEGHGDLYSVRAIHLHPAYTPPTGSDAARNDLALLEVAGLVGEPTYELSRTAPTTGLELTWVGYGVNDAVRWTGDGTRRRGGGAVGDVYFDRYAYVFDGELPCLGDSGAPAFALVGGREQVVGVVSSGDETCSTFGVDTRVDAYVDWIDDVLAGGVTDCAPTGGDCAEGACVPRGAGDGYGCFPSDGIGVGGACDADPESWDAAVPCADGSYCVQVSTDPRDGVCVALCRGDGDCAADEHCRIPLFAEIEDLGFCEPSGAADADADADPDADADVEDDAEPGADADAAEDVPAEDTAPPVDGTDDASGDAPDAGDGDDGCGCRATGARGSAAWPAACLLLGLWASRRVRVRRRVVRRR